MGFRGIERAGDRARKWLRYKVFRGFGKIRWDWILGILGGI